MVVGKRVGAGKPSKTDFEQYSLYRRLFDCEKEDRLLLVKEYALSRRPAMNWSGREQLMRRRRSKIMPYTVSWK